LNLAPATLNYDPFRFTPRHYLMIMAIPAAASGGAGKPLILRQDGGSTSTEQPLLLVCWGGQQPGVLCMVTVTEPSSVMVGAGAASQGWNRSGSSSSG